MANGDRRASKTIKETCQQVKANTSVAAKVTTGEGDETRGHEDELRPLKDPEVFD